MPFSTGKLLYQTHTLCTYYGHNLQVNQVVKKIFFTT